MATSAYVSSEPVNGPSTTEAILDAVLLVIGERGVRGATTRLIAQRAGVNEVTLFRKFGTKSKLIQAAIEARFVTIQRSFGGYTGDLEADLTRLASTYHMMLSAVGPAARAILTEIPHDPELAQSIRGPQRMFAAIAEVLARYQREGVLRPEPPQDLIPAFLGPIIIPAIVKPVADAAGVALSFDAKQYVNRFLYGRAGVTR